MILRAQQQAAQSELSVRNEAPAAVQGNAKAMDTLDVIEELRFLPQGKAYQQLHLDIFEHMVSLMKLHMSEDADFMTMVQEKIFP